VTAIFSWLQVLDRVACDAQWGAASYAKYNGGFLPNQPTDLSAGDKQGDAAP